MIVILETYPGVKLKHKIWCLKNDLPILFPQNIPAVQPWTIPQYDKH